MQLPYYQGPVAFNEAALLDSGDLDAVAHALQLVHELVGELDLPRLAAAYRRVGARHENFRTAFVRTDTWQRQVYADLAFGLQVADLRDAPDPEAAARAQITELFRHPFDRAVPPLLRVVLFRLTDNRQWVVNHCDHLAMDGVTFATALGELMMTYLAMEHGDPPDFGPARQPREHVEALNAQLAAIDPAPWTTPWPADGFALKADPTRPGDDDPTGGRAMFDLGDSAPADAIAKALGVSRSAPLLVAMALGLRAVAGRDDVGFTLIRSGRRDAAARGILGCLAWGDAWTIAVEPGDTYADLLRRADAFVNDTRPGRMLTIPATQPPTSRLVLNLNRYDTSLQLPGIVAFPRLDVVMDLRMWSTHDLLVQAFPMPGMTPIAVRYRASMFEPATIERFGAAMVEAMRALVADPQARA